MLAWAGVPAPKDRTVQFYLEHPVGRLIIWLDLRRIMVKYVWPENVWRKLAWKLPHQLVAWALVRVAVTAMDWEKNTQDPSTLTYPTMFDAWSEQR